MVSGGQRTISVKGERGGGARVLVDECRHTVGLSNMKMLMKFLPICLYKTIREIPWVWPVLTLAP